MSKYCGKRPSSKFCCYETHHPILCSWLYFVYYVFNHVHVTGLFLCRLKISKNCWFSDVFRRLWSQPAAWNMLICSVFHCATANQISNWRAASRNKHFFLFELFLDQRYILQIQRYILFEKLEVGFINLNEMF